LAFNAIFGHLGPRIFGGASSVSGLGNVLESSLSYVLKYEESLLIILLLQLVGRWAACFHCFTGGAFEEEAAIA
jgi:hypothetical protein